MAENKKRDIKKQRKSSSVSENMMSGKFRFLNEKLYTTDSNDAVELFKEKALFDDYHQGYRQ